MKIMKAIQSIELIGAMALTLGCACAADLQMTVATTQESYIVGEPIKISIKIKNTSNNSTPGSRGRSNNIGCAKFIFDGSF
jgi:hypothetical protein